MSNDQFCRLINYYEPVFNRYYRYIKKNTKIDRATFISDCQYVLFKVVRKFDINKSKTEEDAFQRYLISSLTKLCNTIKRRNCSKKNKQTFSIITNEVLNIEDKNIIPILDNVSIDEITTICSDRLRDMGIVRHLYSGYSAKEVCDLMKIHPRKYNAIMKRIRVNSIILKALDIS